MARRAHLPGPEAAPAIEGLGGSAFPKRVAFGRRDARHGASKSGSIALPIIFVILFGVLRLAMNERLTFNKQRRPRCLQLMIAIRLSALDGTPHFRFKGLPVVAQMYERGIQTIISQLAELHETVRGVPATAYREVFCATLWRAHDATRLLVAAPQYGRRARDICVPFA